MASVPAGPSVLETPLQLIKFLRAPYSFFEDNQRRYGDLFRVFFPGTGWVVFVGDPQAVKEIFDRDRSGRLTIRDAGFLGPIFGERSVIVTTEEEHRAQRRAVTPPFHGEAMIACGEAIRGAALRAIDPWVRRGELIIHEAMVELTLDAAIPAVLGPLEPAEARRFHRQLRRAVAACRPELMFFQPLRFDVGPRSPWGVFVRERAAFHELVASEMQRRRAAGRLEGTDLLSALLRVQREEGSSPTDGEIQEQILTMLVLGHESTAAALAWCIHALHREPHVKRAILEELAPLPDSAPSDALAKLPYLNAFCKEVLRLWPVVPEVRRRVLKEPWALAGHDLPAGAYLAPSIYLVHRHPGLYPEPGAFRPERFLQRRFAAHELLPFGGGARSCVGGAFALHEMAILLATLLPRVELRVMDVLPPQPVRQNLSVAPGGGIRVRATHRH